MSVTKRENEKERRAAWKFDEITNGFKVEARYCFPTHLPLFLKKKEICINEIRKLNLNMSNNYTKEISLICFHKN
jgi:hypothetical protein